MTAAENTSCRSVSQLTFVMFFIINVLLLQCFSAVHSEQKDFNLYLDNSSLCQQNFFILNHIDKGKIYSHRNFHDQIYYLSDHHCSITIETKRRAWIAIETFQTNSSVAFPRCTEAKYAGIDDRLQILDGFRNGSILRILCGKDTDQRFDRTPLILKSSKFTIDWQTKSQSFGFALKFVVYDLARDGLCPDSNQFQCRNHRCINRSLICSDDELCGDRSHFEHFERLQRCSTTFFEKKFQNFLPIPSIIFFIVFVLFSPIFVWFCLKSRK